MAMDKEREALAAAVDEFAAAMKKRLLSKLKQGWSGWDYVSSSELDDRILKNAASAVINKDKKSMVDVANLVMMTWRRK